MLPKNGTAVPKRKAVRDAIDPNPTRCRLNLDVANKDAAHAALIASRSQSVMVDRASPRNSRPCQVFKRLGIQTRIRC